MVFPAVLLSLGGLAAWVQAQAYEPADFNVKNALEKLGLDVSQVPPIAGSARSGGNAACSIACSTLDLLYGSEDVITEQDAAYDSFVGSYWSAIQSDLSPRCIFKPSTTRDVSAVVLLARLTKCPFAIKGGGHAAFAGGSSIEGGITVSLEKLNQLTLSSDKKEVTIGSGNRWGDVYRELDALDITVAGGRVSDVGTSGLTLGGGISFLSNIYGWACDNVVKYEVVTAAGYIVNVTSKSNPELYWALRGGGNNFGIVTAFTFRTLPLPKGEMWGGTRTYLETSFEELSDAFLNLITSSPDDPKAGGWVVWLQNSGMKLAAAELWYAKPDGADAAIFDGYRNMTPIADTTQTRVLHEYTDELNEGNPYGLREVYYGLTVKANAEIARRAREILFEELPAIEGVTGGNAGLIFQGITKGQMAHMIENGGNPLGLYPDDGPFYIMHVPAWWENESDDATIYSFISKVLTRIQSEAEKLGVANDYIYMNYASAFENVIASYGLENVARLKSVAKLYDPTGVFQKLQPGGFKLDRAPIPDSGYFG